MCDGGRGAVPQVAPPGRSRRLPCRRQSGLSAGSRKRVQPGCGV